MCILGFDPMRVPNLNKLNSNECLSLVRGWCHWLEYKFDEH